MKFLKDIGIDTPQEFVIFVLTFLIEIVAIILLVRDKVEFQVLFMNPLVGYWLGMIKQKSNGVGNEKG